jgi:1-acyl-sn-glycerol-3-phosphate acyltransferase
MIDLKHLERISLNGKPLGQRAVAALWLVPNYNVFARVDIEVEGVENIPRDETVIFAMNHTDRYNYWPFQYRMWKDKYFFTTVWVKGKYYRNTFLSHALDWCNLIPVPSMRYLIEEFYQKKFRKRLLDSDYRVLRDYIEGKLKSGAEYANEIGVLIKENFREFIRNYHEQIMEKVADHSTRALFEKNLNLIIFPEGTRSLKLAEGRTGLAQMALFTEKKVVPVGCNNSENVYTGTLPIAKTGKIIYRVGEPISVKDRLEPFRIHEKFKPFSPESQARFKAQFEGATGVIMECIGKMVDEKYKKSFS